MQEDDYSHESDIAGDLAQFDEQFENDDVKPIESVPDGNYTVRVEKCMLTRTKEKGHPMLAWQLRIIAGEYNGQMMFRNNVLLTDKNIHFLKKDLLTAGLEISKGESLSKNAHRYCEELLDRVLEVKQVSKEGNTNIWINRFVKTAEGGETNGSGSEAGPPDIDSDIPF